MPSKYPVRPPPGGVWLPGSGRHGNHKGTLVLLKIVTDPIMNELTNMMARVDLAWGRIHRGGRAVDAGQGPTAVLPGSNIAFIEI